MTSRPEPRDEKRRLRRELRAVRRALAVETQARHREALRAHGGAEPLLAGAQTIAGYIASDGELDPGALLERLRQAGAKILLPKTLDDGILALVEFTPETRLEATGPGNTLEPAGPSHQLDDVTTPAVLIAPAVALDRQGRRLGRGGGAYDRLVPSLRARQWTILGACHEDLVADELPSEPHDAHMDGLLTELALTIARPPVHSGSPP